MPYATRSWTRRNPEAIGDLISLEDAPRRRRIGDAVSGGGAYGTAADPPALAPFEPFQAFGGDHMSVDSVRTSSSSADRRYRALELEKERRLADLREQERQQRVQAAKRQADDEAEAERLAEQRRLIELESQFQLENLLGEDQEDRISGVFSAYSRRSDVDAWLQEQEKMADGRENHKIQQQAAGEPFRRQLRVDSRRYSSRPPSNASYHLGKTLKTPEERNASFMADSIASAVKAAIETIQPVDGLRSLMARQSGGRELPDFHGDPEEWPTFLSRFKKSTELCGYNEDENVLRLQRCLKGKAKESVLAMLVSGSNLKAIMGVLEKRFGRPEMIIKKMIEKAKNVTPPTEGDFQAILDFSIAVKNLCAIAESLDLPLYLNNPQLVEEFRRKLPPHLQLEWGRYVVKKGAEKSCDLLLLSRFLDEVSSAAVIVCDASVHQGKKKHKEQCMAVVTNLTCPSGCKECHPLQLCPQFKKMNVKQRWEEAKKCNVCFLCLEKGHRNGGCPLVVPCDVDNCGKNHHPMLHDRKWQPANGSRPRKEETKPPRYEERPKKNEERPQKKEEKPSSSKEVFAAIAKVEPPRTIGKVLLKIAPVLLTGPKGTMKVNAFLDGGCGPTMVEDWVAKALGLDGACIPLHISWQGDISDCDPSSKVVSLKIRGVDEETEYELDNARTKKGLCFPMQPLSSYKLLRKWPHLNTVPFPEVLAGQPAIVIGLEHNYLALDRKLVEGPFNAPVGAWTRLGWVAYGKNGRPTHSDKAGFFCALEEDPDAALHELVKEQFRLESLGAINCKKLPLSQQNQRAEQLMEIHARKIGDYWEAPMLWKAEDVALPESYRAAFSRLRLLEKKIDKDAEMAALYETKIEEYLQKGFCHKLSPSEASERCDLQWFMPHFARINPNKPGKLRLVFDCAAKTNGTSLNDALLQGPDLMAPLVNVLLKFRQREVAFSGDIRDMFHQVRIRQEDVAALRFLWRGKDRSRPPDVYQMDRMVFGAVSSPFQAQWVKNKNASAFEEQYPEAVDAIINRHYVDDYLDSCTTPEEAITKVMNVREIHRRGGFEIRGWLCNNEDVLKVVAPGEQAEAVKNVKEGQLERVLGLHWDPKADNFKFYAKFSRVEDRIMSGEKVPTKRELLRLIMSLFDPLGFVAHLTVRGRILLQDVWRSGIGWDAEIKTEQQLKWKKFLEQLVKIPEALIPRCYAPDVSSCLDLQLHVLCDASQQAFCAVAYLRATGRGGEISVNIVMAKSRVTPLRAVSIPRLELEAALVGARMSKFVREGLDLPIKRTVLWSDSRNVLCWIKAEDPGRFKVYVGNRIGEILDLTEKNQWRWVPTAENVADDGTRDAEEADVSPTSRWFRGPSFLWQPESEWPSEPQLSPANEEDLEVKKAWCMAMHEVEDFMPVEKFSCWMRLVRVTAWMLRAVKNWKARRTGAEKVVKKFLLPSEVKSATKWWIKRVQQSSFQEDLKTIHGGEELTKASKLKGLSPTWKDGIVCVGSRLVNSPNLPDDAKYPVILEASHFWTRLLVAWYHKLHGHQGVDKVLNELRQRYWIIGGKAAVKKAAHNCLECRMQKAKQVPPLMAPLPEARVTRPNRPFTYAGVDYFGPLEVVNGRKREKRYGVLFTCLSTRAVHLEMAYSLSTDDFLMALHRFICRRGEPEELWSDNGTNFRGADIEMQKELTKMECDKIEDKLAAKGIVWKFIPPGSPHFGGAWERLVRSVKTAMAIILRNRTLSDQLLLTVLAEAEASVNSRPLTPVSTDKDDPEAITPNCFLIGTTSTKQPPGAWDDTDLCSRKRWKQVQVLADHFWSRWLKEYLPSLALRSKWNNDTPDIAVGELVFVPDANPLRNEWTKGVVQATYAGKDGRVRVAEVKTVAGVLRRAVAKLYRIPGWNKGCDSS